MEHCSSEVRKGVKWLESYLTNIISKYKENNENIDLIRYAECFYCLYLIDSPLSSEFIEASNNEKFWSSGEDYLWDDSHTLYYLAKLGLDKNKYFRVAIQKYIKDEQTVRGYIQSNMVPHTGPMRALVSSEPESESTKLAVKFFIQNYADFENDPKELSIGILALCEYDFYKYFDIIKGLGEILKKEFSEEGHIKTDNILMIPYTGLALQTLSRVFGNNEVILKKGIDWLKGNQNQDGSWGEKKYKDEHTSAALLCLISAGEGLKISKEEWKQKESLYIQKLNLAKSTIVVTSPFNGEFEIKRKIKDMIDGAHTRLWICSRFITEYWTDLISLKKNKPEVDIKIITIPKKEAKERYIGNGKKFVEPAFDALQRLLGNNLKATSLLHARCIITDDIVLISSADLTEEQMEKEFNLGICSKDPEAVKKSVEIFEDLWNNIYDEKS